ncbi:MAG: HU family DNA-binding protein [Chloroflexota bacterium]|nr:HU family DNA-binding protein [Chloroflexota bacterium]
MPGKSEIVDQVAETTQMKKSDVQRVIEETLNEIRTALNNGEAVNLRGFGNFKVTDREARTGRNPRTGEPIEIPAGKRVSFKMSK